MDMAFFNNMHFFPLDLKCILNRFIVHECCSFWLFTPSLQLSMATTFPPGLIGVFRASLPCYYCLSLLSIIHITATLIHMHGLCHYTWLLVGCRACHYPCQPLFSAVTGDCGRLAHCWASFSQSKSAHVGQSDKFGHVGLEFKHKKQVPLGITVIVIYLFIFVYTLPNTPASNANLTMQLEVHYVDLEGLDI